MNRTQQIEVERKYAVPPEARFPDLHSVDAITTVGSPTTVDLVAVYFDTAGLDLLSRGVTLRRRVGGDDEGWHLKVPAGRDARTETRVPLGRAVRTVPKQLRTAVEQWSGGRPLVPVARISTRRTERRLVGTTDTVVAIVCDDDVHTERLIQPTIRLHWREWEVELDGGGVEVLDALEAALVAVGAGPAEVSSKLARALAEEAPPDRAAPRTEPLDAGDASAGEVLAGHLGEQLSVLDQHHGGLQGETVHRLRIAARRLRSALTTYRSLYEPGAVDALQDELRWLGRALSDARDYEVLGAHLASLVAEEPDARVRAALHDSIEHDLRGGHDSGRRAAMDAVASERYGRLLRTLRAVILSPALRPKASKPARKVLPVLLEREVRRLRRATTSVRGTDQGPLRDEALHTVRKKAKGLRYAAESATPVLGKRARRLAKRAKAVQDSLGVHQDTVSSRVWLEGLALGTDVDAVAAFGAGRLHAREEQRAAQAERDYRKSWRRLDHVAGEHRT